MGELVEAIARAIFRATFHQLEEQRLVDQCWQDWPDDREKALRQARAVLPFIQAETEACAKRGDLLPGLDHIANFLNALDTEGMTATQVRSAIYSECLEPGCKSAIRSRNPGVD